MQNQKGEDILVLEDGNGRWSTPLVRAWRDANLIESRELKEKRKGGWSFAHVRTG